MVVIFVVVKIFLRSVLVVQLIPAGWIAAKVHPQFSQVDCSLVVHTEFTGREKNTTSTKSGKFLPMVNIPGLKSSVNLLTWRDILCLFFADIVEIGECFCFQT